MEWVFKYQNLRMFGLQLNKYDHELSKYMYEVQKM